MEKEISQGVDPVPAMYDIIEDNFAFRVDGKTYTYDYKTIPFTMTRQYVDGASRMCADKALILKHAHE